MLSATSTERPQSRAQFLFVERVVHAGIVQQARSRVAGNLFGDDCGHKLLDILARLVPALAKFVCPDPVHVQADADLFFEVFLAAHGELEILAGGSLLGDMPEIRLGHANDGRVHGHKRSSRWLLLSLWVAMSRKSNSRAACQEGYAPGSE